MRASVIICAYTLERWPALLTAMVRTAVIVSDLALTLMGLVVGKLRLLINTHSAGQSPGLAMEESIS